MRHTVRGGETLSRIARLYNTTVDYIANLNRLTNRNALRVGQVLLIREDVVERKIESNISYNKFTHDGSVCHLFRMPRSIRRRILLPSSVPGTIRTTIASRGSQLAINASFFWQGHPLGPTVHNGVPHGYSLPGYFPINIDTLEVLDGNLQPHELIALGHRNVISAYPQLVHNAIVNVTRVDNGLLPRHPRTALGWNDLEIMVLVADGRSTISRGLTMQQLAVLMAKMGCRQAYNFDGGGSSIAVFGGNIVNRPSDTQERVVVSALAFS